MGRKPLNNKKGYTLIEMLAAVVILGIFLTVSIGGYFAYLKIAAYKKNTEIAKTIFLAAQDALIEERSAGTLEDTFATLDEGNKASVSGYSWQVTYLNTTKDTPEDRTILKSLLEGYLADASVLDNSVVLEFDPSDGTVMAVFYCEKGETLRYDTLGDIDISTDKYRNDKTGVSERKKIGLGYFSAMLSASIPGSFGKPSIAKVDFTNGDVLDLNWTLTDDFREKIADLTYNINFYDSANRLRLQLKLNNGEDEDNKIEFTDNENAFNPLNHLVNSDYTAYKYDAEGNAQPAETGEITLISYIDIDFSVHLILDAADIGASAQLEIANKDNRNYNATFSAMKLIKLMGITDLSEAFLSAKIQTEGENYTTSSWRQSQRQHLLMGDGSVVETQEEGEIKDYKIGNARNFFNLRFMADQEAASSALQLRRAVAIEGIKSTFTQTSSFDWGGDYGLIAAGWLFNTEDITASTMVVNYGNNDIVIEDKSGSFPSVAQWPMGYMLTSEEGFGHTIGYLNLNYNENVTFESEPRNDGFGLFRINRGVIDSISLSDIKVTGKKNVGAFCGYNLGTVANCSVLKGVDQTSKITGEENVGGLIGSLNTPPYPNNNTSGTILNEDNCTNLKSLSNAAEVVGAKNVGGIIGTPIVVAAGNPTYTIEDCNNTGFVHAIATEVISSPTNIGGITGEANSNTPIVNCYSAPALPKGITETQLTEHIDDYLIGKYVGGIVGYAKQVEGNATEIIENCNTGKGYVVGSENVGGIVGHYISTLSLGSNNKCVNKCNVLGEKYVGGIVGVNGGELKNWSNEGVVIATEKYAGGIAGANSAILAANVTVGSNVPSTDRKAEIIDCSTNVNTNSSSGIGSIATAKQLGANCDYVGGITGYNDGVISTTEEKIISVTAICAGKSFVGGLVGYNKAVIDTTDADKTTKVENMKLSGGYISGKYFVGGLVGYNAADNFFEDNEGLNASATLVEGYYFVGGIAGANVIAPTQAFSFAPNVANTFGSIAVYASQQTPTEETGAFMGGVIGYNRLVINDDATETLINSLLIAVTNNDTPKNFEDAYNSVKDVPAVSSDIIMTIGKKDDANQSKIGVKTITGSVCVGGVVGYNAEGSNLTITNIKNETAVTAEGYIPNALTDTTLKGKISPAEITGDINLTYCAGIIGYVGKGVTVDKCTVDLNATVNTPPEATFTGSIAEYVAEDGSVTNCTAGSVRNRDKNNMGGITGLNCGTITDCTLEGTVVGKGNVGGIAAVNAGTIERSTVNGDIYGYEQNIGGVTGFNAIGAIIDSATISCNIEGTGIHVGGLIGYENGGTFEGTFNSGVSTTKSIRGAEYVGGFIGYCSGNEVTIQNITNKASVTATGTNAGGIIGGTSDDNAKVTIINCSNSGAVLAENGLGSGIIPMLLNAQSRITRCTVSAGVSAPNSLYEGKYYNGLITSYNKGTIENCTISVTENYELQGKGYVGAVAGRSEGIIDRITFNGDKTLKITGLAGAEYIGGAVGYNTADLTQCKTDGTTLIEVTSSSPNAYTGGITGYNSADISITTPPEAGYVYSTWDTTLCHFRAKVTLDAGIIGYTGGIAGYNAADATITGYIFEGTLNATGDDKYAYGGIAGYNAGNIAYCVVNDKITDISQQNYNSTSGRYTGEVTISTSAVGNISLGGIAGYNAAGAKVEYSTLAKAFIRGDFGRIGGIVGWNYGDVLNCKGLVNPLPAVSNGNLDMSAIRDVNRNVKIYMYRGDIGGIVGRNEQTGKVQNCSTSADWIVLVCKIDDTNSSQGTDNTCAGIIGMNRTDEDTIANINYAKVYKELTNDNVASGIIGRQENTTTSLWKITDCINYGDVSSKGRCGGVMGQWKYNGGTIERCENYGNITATGNIKENGTAGIVGFSYMPNTKENLLISDCKNFGYIQNNSSAGIFGRGNVMQGATITIVNCINAGRVSGINPSGILSTLEGATATIQGCINYYNFDINSDSGHGISSNAATFYKNISAVDIANPIRSGLGVNGGKGNLNFYISSKSNEPEIETKYDVMAATPTVSLGRYDQWNSITPDNNNNSPSSIVDKNNNVSDLNTYYRCNNDTYYDIKPMATFRIPVQNSEGDYKDITLDELRITFKNNEWNRTRYIYYKIYVKNIITNTIVSYLIGSNNSYERLETYYGNYEGPNFEVTISNTDTYNGYLNEENQIYIEAFVTSRNSFSTSYRNLCLADVSVEGHYTKITYPNIVDDQTQAIPLYKQNITGGTFDASGSYGGKVYTIEGLQFDPNSAANKSRTYFLYTNLNGHLNEKLEDFTVGLYSGNLPSANNFIVDLYSDKGGYTVSWSNRAGTTPNLTAAHHYEIVLNIDGVNQSAVTVYAGNNWHFNSSEYVGKTVKATVTAYNGKGESVSNDSASVRILPALPAPVVTYELKRIDNGNFAYYARLVNRDEYISLANECGVTDIESFLGAVKIVTTLENNQKEFTALEGEVQANDPGGWGVVISLSAYAETTLSNPSNYVIGSRNFGVQTHKYAVDNNNDEDIIDKNIIGWTNKTATAFNGLTPDSLSYKLVITGGDSHQAIYRFEYVRNCDVGGVNLPVAISGIEERISANVDIYLKGLTDVIQLEDYTVRAYVTATQEQGLTYGHYAAQGITAAEVLTLTDPLRNNTRVVTGNDVADGYSIRLNEDNTYDVYYSVGLHTGVSFANYMEKTGTVPAEATAPTITTTSPLTPNTNGSYTFAWSVPGVANPIVHLKITGFKPGDDPATSPEKGILLYNGEVIGTSHTFTAEDIASWSYKNVVVEVTRQGIQGASGYTTSLGSKASKTIEVPLALPTVLRPLVLIDGRESLVYEIAWNAPADAQAVTDTANYGIYVNDALLHTTEGNANYTAKVDLGAYAGREIEVYVIANVKTSPAVYTASSRRSDLETAQITVMTRAALGSPSVTLPGFAYNDTPLSVPAFLEGPTITVQNSTTGLASGAYRFEACVCSVGTGSVLPTLDGGRLTDIFADTMTSSTPGSLAEATYKLEKLGGLPMERNYNAKYLWVRVRVEPEDSVYSEWSAWQIVRLAKIKLNTPSVVRTTENVTFEEINSASEENPPAITVPMTLLSFTWEEYAQKYEISIVENASGTSAEHEIILQRNNGAIQQGETPLPIVDGIYTLNDYMIPINVKVGTDEYEFEVPASVRISTSGTNTTVTLYLPDFDSFTLNVNNTTYTHIVHATQSVSITAIPDESTGGPSDPAIYNQVKVGNKYEWVMP